MAQTNETTISIAQASSEPVYSYSNASSITKVILSQSTTHQQTFDSIIQLGIMENESIADANNDMDLLAGQSLEDP